GDTVTPGEVVEVDGRTLEQEVLFPSSVRILAYYKPEGELVSRRDPQGRPTVFRKLPQLAAGSWRAVGRLDLNTSGLLLFTTDGELANRLMHPATGIDREYAVRIRGAVSEEAIRNLLAGVELEDGPARFTDIVEVGGEGANRWYHVCLMEGRKREVRRLWESQGVQVSRLIRVRFGPVVLPRSARPGSFWDLERDEVDALLEWSGMEHLKERVARVREARGRGK
ncbi:MAG: pseudouridine synthase, partial [Gammaproteobacteria bacterium]